MKKEKYPTQLPRARRKEAASRLEKKQIKDKSGSNQFAHTLEQIKAVQFISENNADELDDTGKEKIRFERNRMETAIIRESKGILEEIDGSFYGNAMPVKVIPMGGTARNAWIQTEILIGIGIDASSVRRIRAGMLTGTDSPRGTRNALRFVANPFEAR